MGPLVLLGLKPHTQTQQKWPLGASWARISLALHPRLPRGAGVMAAFGPGHAETERAWGHSHLGNPKYTSY